MFSFRRLTTIVTAAVACTMTATLGLSGVGAAGGAAPAKKYPVSWDFRSAIPNVLNQTLDANWSPPPGTNDPSCKLTKERPNPPGDPAERHGDHAVGLHRGRSVPGQPWVLRVHVQLRQHHADPQLPDPGLDDIERSAREVSRNVDRIMRQTGAKKVDLVGWSQGGGLLPHYYVDFLGGDKKVDKVIGIAPGNHGSTGDRLTYVRYFIPPFGPVGYDIFKALFPPAFAQQAQYSDLVRKVYGNGDTKPGPHYPTIVTKYDEIATPPFTNGFLEGDNVTNILLQDDCPVDLSEHLSINFSERTWRHVRNALTPAEATRVPVSRSTPPSIPE